ncbi:MAG: type I glutamate--ammonia ligase [Alphaproteobacteria bacterium]|nr:type I glutamate--ammonia ligase [Alphaproteobacteria bacterium]MCD8526340.1 type I glutamate--ammonia ligase [Alphaproteobacteria bacterium]MCD8570146.1 type I glutamate--ammonia ligase [Alphaproteobacteria bacterium]
MSALSFKTPANLLKFIADNDIQYIDFNFTDLRGKWQHTTQHVRTFDQDMIARGIFFDGSSIAGWKAINESDMGILPDINKVCFDPFAAQKTIKIFCDVIEPSTGKPYECDPRFVARSAEEYLKKSGLGDTAYFGPEPEFFIFEDVRIHTEQTHVGYSIDSEELPGNSGKAYPGGNMGHRPLPKGGYFPESPVDNSSDIRGEMVSVMQAMGLPVEKHHHEVAPAQSEIGISYSTLVDCADNVQIYKHVVQNVAHSYGKTATFMPKPMFGDNGSGMHVHQSVWKGSKSTFAGDKYAGLSDTALYYIGGIIKHARALNAFTNPTTNSYKRLVPGYEAPVLLAYSARNRSASCRIPMAHSENAKRVEVRFPDPLANPYLAFAAMLMAGIDGIENKIDPGKAMDQNLYDLPKAEQDNIPHVCSSLRQALDALKADHDFLLKGDVFSQTLIDSYIDLKMSEVEAFETMPHPIEFKMYYSS